MTYNSTAFTIPEASDKWTLFRMSVRNTRTGIFLNK